MAAQRRILSPIEGSGKSFLLPDQILPSFSAIDYSADVLEFSGVKLGPRNLNTSRDDYYNRSDPSEVIL